MFFAIQQMQMEISYSKSSIDLRSLGSHKSNALNGRQIGVETKKLWSIKASCAGEANHFKTMLKILKISKWSIT